MQWNLDFNSGLSETSFLLQLHCFTIRESVTLSLYPKSKVSKFFPFLVNLVPQIYTRFNPLRPISFPVANSLPGLWIMSNQVTELIECLLHTQAYTRCRGVEESQGRKLWPFIFWQIPTHLRKTGDPIQKGTEL